MDRQTDELYRQKRAHVEDFTFDAQTAAVFPDMLHRSIPGYGLLLDRIAALALNLSDGAVCFDLGCSTGETSLQLLQSTQAVNLNIQAVDNSAAMIERCQAITLPTGTPRLGEIRFICADICHIDIRNADLVMLNYTLQFIDPTLRLSILQQVYQGLKPDGILLLSEKIAFEDDAENQRQIDAYHAFKKRQGYSDMEIAQKQVALKNILIPDTLETHQQRLAQAGFRTVTPWFQQYNFMSMQLVK